MKKFLISLALATLFLFNISVCSYADDANLIAKTKEEWGYDTSTLLGDVNGDYNINILDLVCIKKHLLGKKDIIIKNADIDKTGEIEASDIILLVKILLYK